jgi:hypothetical protein
MPKNPNNGGARPSARSDGAADEAKSPEALRAFQKAETERWWPIIKAANLKAE